MKTKQAKLALPKHVLYGLMVAVSTLFINVLNAQKNLAGFYWGGEIELSKHLGSPFVGFSYERKITDHFGFETGTHLNFKSHSAAALIDGKTFSREITYVLTSVPLLVKTYTDVINLSAGLAANIRTRKGKREIKRFHPGKQRRTLLA